MNEAILDYIRDIKFDYPEIFKNNSVVEFGSLNVNGSAREVFDSKKYIGVDASEGKGVDFKCLCHRYSIDKFDVVISTEMLEHDPYWDLSVVKMLSLLKEGGSLIITAAGPDRHPHGQKTYTPLSGYYRNIKSSELLALISTCNFKRICLDNDDNKFLLLFCYYKF